MNVSILDQLDAGDAPGQGPAETQTRWSGLQQAIFEAVRNPHDNLLIQAVAGSGKSTTIIEATKWAPGSSLFMAFNKAIAEDIRRKGPGAEVKTLNALGHLLVMRNRPAATLNARKTLEILKKIMGEGQDFKDDGYTLSRVIGLAKNCAFGLEGPPDTEGFISLIEAYAFDIPFDKLSSYATICREAFEQSRLDETTFDFDDQLWLPIYNRWTFPSYDNIFIDECQDLSPIQHLMAAELRSAASTMEGRIVAVGDRHQAIYGFRGASHNSMDELRVRFGMKELPLSISYRCAQEIVLAAREFCPTIEWRPDAPLGVVRHAESDPQIFGQVMIVPKSTSSP